MNLRNHQHGASLAGWIVIILVFGSTISIGAKLAPLYFTHNTMSEVLDQMAAEDGLAFLGKRELYASLRKRFKINSIRDFAIEEKVEIERTANGTELRLVYEERLPLVHNVDLIASFSKIVELRK